MAIDIARRQFMTALGGATVAWPLAARAQQSLSKVPVVGVLWHAGSAEEEDVYLSVLVKAFNDLGYVEGKNIHLEHRFPAENPDRFRTLGRELIDAKPDAIVGVTAAGAVTLKELTSTIPIVFVLVPDPIASGLVESLARPGGNARPIAYGGRFEWEAFRVIERSCSEPIACRASAGPGLPAQRTPDKGQSDRGRGAGNFVVASRGIGA
jgi:hypothetical protein